MENWEIVGGNTDDGRDGAMKPPDVVGVITTPARKIQQSPEPPSNSLPGPKDSFGGRAGPKDSYGGGVYELCFPGVVGVIPSPARKIQQSPKPHQIPSLVRGLLWREGREGPKSLVLFRNSVETIEKFSRELF
jgi:hypothetical protein